MEWLRDHSAGDETVRVLCLPPAGGSARPYRRWAGLLPGHVGVVAVELPGHGDRLTETPIDDLPTLIQGMLPEVRTLLDRPLVVFGHSMGALVAAELCRALLVEREWRPLLLVAAGCMSPDRPSVPDYVTRMTDEGILDFLTKVGGTPPDILANDEYLGMIRPVVRADLEAIAHRDVDASPRLGCAVRAYLGADDPRVDAEQAAGWAIESDGDFGMCTFPGGHFFVQDHVETVLSRLRRGLAEALRMRGRDRTPAISN
ncbi:thioesterase II family protein [Amycolatopsis australiensis]|uniref:Surfactin synthase thioesterase subunit n=1 Tax=Amycolatopsis australiensis TaxID=546364 RepID=A0A1K1RLM6_9PSEU|nr:alpha/beta fold hydrolase [Amycolatopsis australiensis]SFW72917.1 Surfactin synthase thioesterase subunit [Amycolatopsis australiensis]